MAINFIVWGPAEETVALTIRRKSDEEYWTGSGWQPGSATVAMTEDSSIFGSPVQSAYVSGTAPTDPYVWVAKTATNLILGGDPSTFDPANDSVASVTQVGTTANLTNMPAGVALDATVAKQVTLVALNNISTTDVNTEVLAVLNSYDPPTKAELDSAVAALPAANVTALLDEVLDEITADPGATPAVRNLLMILYHLVRNQLIVTKTEKQIHNDAGTIILEQDVDDNETRFLQSKFRVPN